MTPKQIKTLLNSLGGSSRNIAILLEVSPSTIHRWVNGDCEINLLNQTNLEVLSQIIKKESKVKKIDAYNLVKLVALLMEHNLWKGWVAFSKGEIHESN